MIWGRNRSWVLWRGDNPGLGETGEEREKEGEKQDHTGDCTKKTLSPKYELGK